MEIKRYTVMDILKTTTNGTEIYYSRADLIAAGVLVPVLEGDNPGCMRLVRLEDVG